MFFIVSRYLTPKGFRGLTLYPFVFVKFLSDLDNPDFVNHEKIHLRQQIELFILPFYIWYVVEYLFRLVQYRNGYQAYRNISFEREAYRNETNLDYLKYRGMYRFVKFL
ncbi:hypothetical protein [Flavobacterium sp.]|uniref:hypothetical protein n=1 Tax=Flavobacterium sp. TaxID=239 RepID=UPI003C577E84